MDNETGVWLFGRILFKKAKIRHGYFDHFVTNNNFVHPLATLSSEGALVTNIHVTQISWFQRQITHIYIAIYALGTKFLSQIFFNMVGEKNAAFSFHDC